MFEKIKKIKELFSNHSGKINVASYTALIIAGFTGYTNLLTSHGKLQASVEFKTEQIAELQTDIDRITVVYSKLNADYKHLVRQCVEEQ